MSHAASPLAPNALTTAADTPDTPPDTAPAAQTAVTIPADLPPDLPRETLAAFVATLAQWGNVRAAAQQAGVSRAHLYRMRRASVQFRTLWDAALLLARPQVEEVLADRALNGVQETVFYHGEEVATRTRYDSRLLLAHLARLDRLGTSHAVAQTARDFDAELERLLNPPPAYDWGEEEDWLADDAFGEDETEDYPAD
jgi:DNA-binding phage protein